MERQLLAWGKLHTSLSGSPGLPSTYPALLSFSEMCEKEKPDVLQKLFQDPDFTLDIKCWSKNEAEDQTSCSVMRSRHSCRSSLSSGVRIFRISCSSWPSTRMRKLRTSVMKWLNTDSSCSSVDHQRAMHYISETPCPDNNLHFVLLFVCLFLCLGENTVKM